MLSRRTNLAVSLSLASLALACGAHDRAKNKDSTSTSTGGTTVTGAGGSSGGSITTGGSVSSGGTTDPSGGTGGSVANTGGGGAGNPTGGAGGGGTGAPPSCTDAEVPEAAPAATWVNATGNLAGMPSACANLGMMAAQPCSKAVVVVVAASNMWSTTDRGTSWQELGTGDGSAAVDNGATSIVFDPEVPTSFWETGLHTGGGAYRTTDNGVTFQQVPGLQGSQLISVDFSDPERTTQLAGTHGGKQQLYLSTDGGQSFNNIGTNLGADLGYSESPIVIDDHTFLVGTQDPGSGTCGIYRSTDTGVTWTQQVAECVNHYGGPLWASDGAIYWPLWNNAGLVKSTDLGVSWDKIIDENTIKGVTPRELPDGSIITLGTDHIVRTTDGGTSWSPIGDTVPFQIQGTSGAIAYSSGLKTIFLSQWDCGSSVLSNAVMAAGYDYEN